MPSKLKGHWPRGRRRHPQPLDWPRIVEAMNEAFHRRQGRLLAKKIGVRHETLIRWRAGIDLPAPERRESIIASLYALRLYRQKKATASSL